jgi:hypothetical protein
MRREGAGEPVTRKTLTVLQSLMGLAVLHRGTSCTTNPERVVRKPAQVRRDAEPTAGSTSPSTGTRSLTLSMPDAAERARRLASRR